MEKIKNNDDEALMFELKDLEIFRIKDLKLKLDTLQNYFFPRMDKLLSTTLEIARDVYGTSILDDFTITKSPRHRPATKYDGKDLDDFGSYVTIGVSGLRNNGYLIVKRKTGQFAKIPPTAIEYQINSNGVFNVYMDVTRYGYVTKGNNDTFYSKVTKFFKKYNDIIMILLNHANLCYYPEYDNFEPLYKMSPTDIHITSVIYYLPIDREEKIFYLRKSFIALMPIWHALVRISRGKETLFEEHIKSLKEYWKKLLEEEEQNDNTQNDDDYNIDNEEISDEIKSVIDNLDDYKSIAAGKWWTVLSRDNWTCCSCGRSSREGFILHVDHIVPRSKNGSDDINNLQTLCMKCNIGKSNKDQTDLRANKYF